MKTNFKKAKLFLALLSGIVIINSCRMKDPLEGFSIAVKTDVVSASLIYRVVYAKKGFSKKEFDNVPVTISGPGSVSLYDADGKKVFKIVEGRIGVCVRKGVNPVIDNPLRFNVRNDVP